MPSKSVAHGRVGCCRWSWLFLTNRIIGDSRLWYLGPEASRIIRITAMTLTGCRDVWDALQVYRERLFLARVSHSWAFNTQVLDDQHQRAKELVAARQPGALILETRPMKEYHIEVDCVHFDQFAKLSQNVCLKVTFLLLDKFKKSLTELVNLIQGCAELELNRDGFGQTT